MQAVNKATLFGMAILATGNAAYARSGAVSPAAMIVARQTAGEKTAAISADGALYALVDTMNRVQVFRRGTEKAARSFNASKEAVMTLAFSSDGRYLGVGSADRKVRVYDMENGDKAVELQSPPAPAGTTSRIGAIAFSSDNKEIVFSDSALGWLVRYGGPEPKRFRAVNSSVTSTPLLSLVSDQQGGYIGGDALGRFHFFDSSLAERGLADTRVSGPILSLTVTNDSRLLVGDTTEVKVFSFTGDARQAMAGGLRLLSRYPVGAAFSGAAYPGNGLVTVVDASGVVRNVSAAAPPPPVSIVSANNTAATTPPPVDPTPPPVTPTVVPPTTAVTTPPTTPPPSVKPATGTGKPNKPNKPREVVRTPPPTKRPTLPQVPVVHVTQTHKLVGHSEYVNGVVFSPDGKEVVSGSRDKTVRLWDVASGDQKALLGKHGNFVSAVAFSPDGSRLISGGWDNLIYTYDAATNARVSGAGLTGHTSFVLSLAYTPDGTRFASGSNDKTARVWNPQTRTSRATRPLPDAISSVAYSPDGTKLAGGCLDGSVYIWDAQTLERVKVLPGSQSHPVLDVVWLDNDTLVSGGKRGGLRQWSLRAGKVTATLLPDGANDVYAIAYNAQKRLLATGGTDRLVRVWAVSGGGSTPVVIKAAARATGQGDTVRSLAWSSDGAQIASGGWDFNILLWKVSVETGPGGVAAQ